MTELACALRRAGVEPVVISELPVPRSNSYARQLRREGIELVSPHRTLAWANHLRRSLCRLTGGWPTLFDHNNEIQAIIDDDLLSNWLIRVFKRHCRARRPDLIHLHGCRFGQAWVLRWAQLHRLPSVYTEHTAVAQQGGPQEGSGPQLALAASALACVSEHSRKEFLSFLPKPRPVAITGHILPSQTPTRTTGGKRDDFRFLCASRLETWKGIDVLLRAFAPVAGRHRRVRLILAGDGRLRPPLEALARELGIGNRIEFRGHLEPEQMAEALDQADAVVIPSLSEGLPLVLLEAMASGKPIVASAAGGIPEMIRNGENGLLATPGDPGELARALDLVVADPALRQRLGAAALGSYAQSRYQEHAVIEDILELYTQAVGTRTGSSRHAQSRARVHTKSLSKGMGSLR